MKNVFSSFRMWVALTMMVPGLVGAATSPYVSALAKPVSPNAIVIADEEFNLHLQSIDESGSIKSTKIFQYKTNQVGHPRLSLSNLAPFEFLALFCAENYFTHCAFKVFKAGAIGQFTEDQTVEIDPLIQVPSGYRFSIREIKIVSENQIYANVTVENEKGEVSPGIQQFFERKSVTDPFKATTRFENSMYFSSLISDFFIHSDFSHPASLYAKIGTIFQKIYTSYVSGSGPYSRIEMMNDLWLVDESAYNWGYAEKFRVLELHPEKSPAELSVVLDIPKAWNGSQILHNGIGMLPNSKTFAFSDNMSTIHGREDACGTPITKQKFLVSFYDLGNVTSSTAAPDQVLTIDDQVLFPNELRYLTPLSSDEFMLMSCEQLHIFKRASAGHFVHQQSISFSTSKWLEDYHLERIDDATVLLRLGSSGDSKSDATVLFRRQGDGSLRLNGSWPMAGMVGSPIFLKNQMVLVYKDQLQVIPLN